MFDERNSAPPLSELITAPTHYRILKNHLGRGFESIDQIAWTYINCTEKLIKTINGVDKNSDRKIKDDPKDGQYNGGNFDVVVYLDKSARPVSWLVRKFWPEMSSVTKEPVTRFLNINHKDEIFEMVETTGCVDPADRYYNFSKIPEDKVLAIRALFGGKELSPSNWQSEVKKEGLLDKKNILIVDEVESSGNTLFCAQRLLKLAFPTSKVHGVYYWDSRFKYTNVGRRLTSAPAWYNGENVFGRGVGNVNKNYYKKNPGNFNIKLGSFVISAPHLDEEGKRLKVKDDELAVSLRNDIDHLHRDYLGYLEKKSVMKT